MTTRTKMTIAELRRSQDISQTDLAKLLSTSQSQVYRLEAGKQAMKVSSLEALAKAFGGELEVAVHLKGARIVLDLFPEAVKR